MVPTLRRAGFVMQAQALTDTSTDRGAIMFELHDLSPDALAADLAYRRQRLSPRATVYTLPRWREARSRKPRRHS